MQKSEAALIKMKSSNSIILRIYSLMRLLHENFDYSFILNKEKRKPKDGLSYYSIKKILNHEMKLKYDEDTIRLEGVEKTKYCRYKVLDILIKLLEENGYVFKKSKTNLARKVHGVYGEYPAITIEKLKSYTIDFLNNEKCYNMVTIENYIGFDTYCSLKHCFTEQVNIKECIVCHNYKLNEVSKCSIMKSSHLEFPLNNGFIEEEFAKKTNECGECVIKFEQNIITSDNNTTSNMNNVIDDTLNIINTTQMELDTQLNSIDDATKISSDISTLFYERNGFDKHCYNQINYNNCFETTISFINNTNNRFFLNHLSMDCNRMDSVDTHETPVNIMTDYNQFNTLNMYFDPYTDEHYYCN